MIAGIKRISCK